MERDERRGQWSDEVPTTVTARALLKESGYALIFTMVGVAGAMLFSVFLVGFLLFAAITLAQVRSHQTFAFKVEPRRSWIAFFLVAGLALGALFICGSWLGAVEVLARGSHFQGVRLGMTTLPIAYAMSAWILAPLAFLVVLLLDPKAPSSLRHLVPLALRVTSEIPTRSRIVAVVVSGSVLVGPISLAAFFGGGSRLYLVQFSVLWSFLTIPIFVPLASALLVSNYSRVRHELSLYRGKLPNFPAGMALLTTATLGVSAFAAYEGFAGQPLAVLILGATWIAVVAALLSFLSAHRIRCLDPMSEGATPGRRAIEGRLHRSENGALLVAGPLTFRIPSHALSDAVADGTTLTLIGDLAATTQALFRDRAEQAWPKGAKLHARDLDAVVTSHVRFATWVSYIALGTAVALSGEILTNIF